VLLLAEWLGDLHVFDEETRGWTDLTNRTGGTPPSERTSMGMAASMGNVYIFGGYSNTAGL